VVSTELHPAAPSKQRVYVPAFVGENAHPKWIGLVPTTESRPMQLSLDTAPKAYQDLGLALARRIERRDLRADDLQEILRILGREGDDFDE
jgi:hypothetical protein